MKNTITRQQLFDITYIDYDKIKAFITIILFVEYNTSIGVNATKEGYQE